MSHVLGLIVSSIVLVLLASGCQLPVLTFPNPAISSLSNGSGCSFPIQRNHNWSMTNLQLPPLPHDSANPDWKYMFGKFANSPACFTFQVGYTINQHIGLDFLEIGVECQGKPYPGQFKFEITYKLPGASDIALTLEYSGGRITIDPDCILFGTQQQFELEVGVSLRIIENSTAVMTLGPSVGTNESIIFRPCNCASIRAYELLLQECHSKGSKQPFLYDKSATVQSSADNHVWLTAIILISVGILLMAIIYGSKYVENGRDS